MTTTEKLAEALRNIAEPIPYLMRQVEPGYTLDGHAVIRMTERPEFYRQMAREALAQLEAERAAPAPASAMSDAVRLLMDHAFNDGAQGLERASGETEAAEREVLALAAAGHAPKPQPLTDEQIDGLILKYDTTRQAIRAAERLLGIWATKGDSE